MQTLKAPTGNPKIPKEVRLANEAFCAIRALADLGTREDNSTIEHCYTDDLAGDGDDPGKETAIQPDILPTPAPDGVAELEVANGIIFRMESVTTEAFGSSTTAASSSQ